MPRIAAPASAAGGALLAAAPAADDGGFFPGTWAWVAIVASLIALVAASSSRRPRGAALAFVSLLAGLAAWTLVSTLWSKAPGASVLEAQRALAYVAVAVAVVLVVDGRNFVPALGGGLAGIVAVCGDALAERLSPSAGTFDSSIYRLEGAIGYWNGLGLYATMGLLIALGLATRADSLWVRALAASTTPVLAITVIFTFSRGALLALGVGVVAGIMTQSRRGALLLTTCIVAIPGAVAAVAAARSGALVTRTATLSEAAAAGHRLAAILALLVPLAAAAPVMLSLCARRLRLPRPSRTVRLGAAVGAASVTAALLFAAAASVDPAAQWARVTARPPASDDLSGRLTEISANNRFALWRVAWDDARAAPVLGQGAGTYSRSWNARRPYEGQALDAHNLYLETLAELGLVGAALLAAWLLVAGVAAVPAARRVPAAWGACGAAGAYALHAAVDWDWELVGVTCVFLLCTGGLMGARQARHGRRAGSWRTPTLLATVGLAAVSVGVAGGAVPHGRALAALDDGQFAVALAEARQAERRAPWAVDLLRIQGEALTALGRPAAARAVLRRAVTRDPGSFQLWVDLALVSRGNEREEALVRAAALNPLSRQVRDLRAPEG